MLAVSCREMREIDRRAVEEYGIPAETLMENAGAAVARESLKFLAERRVPKPRRIVVACGGGNNGGDGFVAARLLAREAESVSVLLFKPTESLAGAALANFKKLAPPVAVLVLPRAAEMKNILSGAALVVDALLGTGFKGIPQGTVREAIEAINGSGRPVVAVDVPSGLDADSGKASGECVRAALTVTMGLPKIGFLLKGAEAWTGEVAVAEIGFPAELIEAENA